VLILFFFLFGLHGQILAITGRKTRKKSQQCIDLYEKNDYNLVFFREDRSGTDWKP
jgi:hypothetical protein